MTEKRNNYQILAMQAKKLFLTYDQQELIRKCCLRFDEDYLYTKMLSEDYRIRRNSGDMERLHKGEWLDGNGYDEVMTILDWLCDSKPERHITGLWVNPVSHGPYFHRSLQEQKEDPNAIFFSQAPGAFCKACEELGGEKMPGADIGYAIELLDGLRIFVQLWYGDEEFSPKFRCLWDENTPQYLRYETTWYALDLLKRRIKERM